MKNKHVGQRQQYEMAVPCHFQQCSIKMNLQKIRIKKIQPEFSGTAADSMNIFAFISDHWFCVVINWNSWTPGFQMRGWLHHNNRSLYGSWIHHQIQKKAIYFNNHEVFQRTNIRAVGAHWFTFTILIHHYRIIIQLDLMLNDVYSVWVDDLSLTKIQRNIWASQKRSSNRFMHLFGTTIQTCDAFNMKSSPQLKSQMWSNAKNAFKNEKNLKYARSTCFLSLWKKSYAVK